MARFDSSNWYWAVDGSTTHVYSSKSNTYVPVADAAYVAWLASENIAVPIQLEADIWPYVSNKLPEWLFRGGTFAQPGVGQYTPAQLIAYASSVRYNKEIGGIIFSGIPVATDDRSKLMVTGGRIAANSDTGWTTIWQGSDGNSYQLNATEMIAISNAVQDHVSGCFATFATVFAAIDAGTMTTMEQVDAAFA
jgi:hypothetical protein